MNEIANTPQPPYYAVIFTSLRTDVDDGYGETAVRMLELAVQQPGLFSLQRFNRPFHQRDHLS